MSHEHVRSRVLEKYEECKGKMTWGWMTVWCEIHNIWPLNKDIMSIEVARHVPMTSVHHAK